MNAEDIEELKTKRLLNDIAKMDIDELKKDEQKRKSKKPLTHFDR